MRGFIKATAVALAASAVLTMAGCEKKPGEEDMKLEPVPFETVDKHRVETLKNGYQIDMGDIVQVYFEEHPEWVELYNKSWKLHKDHIQQIPEATNPESPYYVDEAFSDDIFLWDTVFMMLYDRYGMNQFPVLASMENFYYRQTDSTGKNNGYIPREIAEKTGKDYYAAGYRDQNSTNPPLLSWAEWECYQIHGDVTRFSKVINGKTIYERLCDHYEFINKNKLEKKFGLYGKTGGLGTGLDDSPNQGANQIYNSLTMQQAQNAYFIAKIAEAMGKTEDAAHYMAEHDKIAAKANELMWDEAESMYSNLTAKGEHTNVSTPTSLWAMVARVATTDTAEAMVRNQALNSNKMFRPNGLATVAYDHKEYAPYGGYWKGSIWAPTSYQYVKGLVAYNYLTEAFEESIRLVNTLSAVYEAGKKGGYVPKATLYENYSAEYIRDGWWKTDCELTRQDFAGWTPCMSIGLMIENLVGVTLNAPENTIVWNANLTEHHSISNLYFVHEGVANRVSLAAAKRTSADEDFIFSVQAEQPCKLVLTAAGVTKEYEITAGLSTFKQEGSDHTAAAPAIAASALPAAALTEDGAVDSVYFTETEDESITDGLKCRTGMKKGLLFNVNTVGLSTYQDANALQVVSDAGTVTLRKPYYKMGNDGFILCAEAKKTTRTLKLYVSVSEGAEGTVTASLSDASAPAVKLQLTAGEHVVEIPYSAASDGRYLLVKFVLDNDTLAEGSEKDAYVGFTGAVLCE